MQPIARPAVWRLGLRLLALLAPCGIAHAEIVELAWDAAGRFERHLSVAPGRFIELCGKLTAKTQVQWQFDAETATDFNIHFHAGKAVRYPVKEDGVTRANGTLQVSREEDYCWMWSNRSSQSAELSVRLKRTH